MPEETQSERLNRNFDDLLQELRVSQNGTQILFAFLLTVPFSNGFKTATDLQRDVYFATLLLASLSAAMLIAPAAMHRMLFRRHQKDVLVRVATKVALGGLVLLTVAVAGSVFLIGDYVFNHVVAVVVGVVALLWWTTFFFLLPLWIRGHGPRDPAEPMR